jgi:hypothetical protein
MQINEILLIITRESRYVHLTIRLVYARVIGCSRENDMYCIALVKLSPLPLRVFHLRFA